MTRSCGSDTPRSLRPESCCSHVASAPAAIRTPAFAGSPPGTAFTSTPWTRHRAAASPPTGRPWSAIGAGTRWVTTSSSSVRTPSAVPEVPRRSHEASGLWDARHLVRRALEVPQRLSRQRREVDLLEMPAQMVTHSSGQAARRSINLFGSAAGTVTGPDFCVPPFCTSR